MENFIVFFLTNYTHTHHIVVVQYILQYYVRCMSFFVYKGEKITIINFMQNSIRCGIYMRVIFYYCVHTVYNTVAQVYRDIMCIEYLDTARERVKTFSGGIKVLFFLFFFLDESVEKERNCVSHTARGEEESVQVRGFVKSREMEAEREGERNVTCQSWNNGKLMR